MKNDRNDSTFPSDRAKPFSKSFFWMVLTVHVKTKQSEE